MSSGVSRPVRKCPQTLSVLTVISFIAVAAGSSRSGHLQAQSTSTGVAESNEIVRVSPQDASPEMSYGSVIDKTPPSVSITSPVAEASVAGTITIAARATDNTEVAAVQFLVDGMNFGAEDKTSPYSLSWNTKCVVNGPHTLTAIARDAAGNLRISLSTRVAVANELMPPIVEVEVETPASGTTPSDTTNVVASAADNVEVVGARLPDGSNLGPEHISVDGLEDATLANDACPKGHSRP